MFRCVECATVSKEQMTKGRIGYIDAASHFVLIDEPEKVNPAIREFIKEN